MFFVNIGYKILKEFFSLTFSVMPYFILGTAFGALLKTRLKPDFVIKYLNRGASSVINASILGAILPGCACATMPMAEGLKEKKARLGTIASFIMISPLLSPQTVILTYALLGWKFTIARVIFSLSGAVILGITFNYFEKLKVRGFVSSDASLDAEGGPCPPACKVEKIGFWKVFIGIIKDLGKYFILGMFIASLLTVLVPKEAIPKYIGSSGVFAYLAAALVGIPIYICEGEEIPITLALLKLGLGKGPVFTFLLGAVGTCIPTMLMAQKIIGKKPVLIYIIYWFLFAISSGLLFSSFF
ncbi:MAG: permease [Candidatus Omnitrophota bacterium]|nr:permease [Candidatus Omnitrophota bacterium]